MGTLTKPFRIVVLEDSKFYNRLFTRQLERYTDTLTMELGVKFDIRSYLHPEDFLLNLRPRTDLAFLDYFLGNGVHAETLIKRIKERCPKCKVVVISHSRNIVISAISIAQGAYEFIRKDKQALPRSCFLVEDMVNARLSA